MHQQHLRNLWQSLAIFQWTGQLNSFLDALETGRFLDKGPRDGHLPRPIVLQSVSKTPVFFGNLWTGQVNGVPASIRDWKVPRQWPACRTSASPDHISMHQQDFGSPWQSLERSNKQLSGRA